MVYTRTTNSGVTLIARQFADIEVAELLSQGIDIVAEANSAVDQEVERMNKENFMSTALVYTKDACPYCVRAKALLKIKGVETEERNINTHLDEMKQAVMSASGVPAQTLPQIFLDGAYIGGFDKLVEHYKKNA